MTILFDEKHATLDGHCRVDEAEGLLNWALAHPRAGVRMATCTHLHAAILQTLLAVALPLLDEPQHPDVCRLLTAAGYRFPSPEGTPT